MTSSRPRIVILREPRRAAALRTVLEANGYEVVVRPVTQVVFQAPGKGENWAALVENAECVAFTSRNGVEGLARGLGLPAEGSQAESPFHSSLRELLRGRRVAALGRSAAQLSEEHGVPPSIVETSGGSAELAKQLCAALPPHSRVLYPCSASAMPHLTERLTHVGHEVRKLVCYTTVPIPLGERLTLEWSSINAVVVAAPSAVIALAEEPGLAPGLPFIAIGAATAAALLDRGMRLAAISPTPEIGGLARAVKSAC